MNIGKGSFHILGVRSEIVVTIRNETTGQDKKDKKDQKARTGQTWRSSTACSFSACILAISDWGEWVKSGEVNSNH